MLNMNVRATANMLISAGEFLHSAPDRMAENIADRLLELPDGPDGGGWSREAIVREVTFAFAALQPIICPVCGGDRSTQGCECPTDLAPESKTQ